MSKLQQLVKKSQNSSFYKKVLNFVLARSIPFNAPHHLQVVSILKGNVSVKLPYKRANLNHVKGIHACALATLCEYTTGLALLTMISENEYRIILKSLKIDYHYQARMNVEAGFELSQEFVSEHITTPLNNNDAVFTDLIIQVHDESKNHICTGYISWQIKKWNRVNTSL